MGGFQPLVGDQVLTLPAYVEDQQGPFAVAQALTRRANWPSIRIRCVSSSWSSLPGCPLAVPRRCAGACIMPASPPILLVGSSWRRAAESQAEGKMKFETA